MFAKVGRLSLQLRLPKGLLLDIMNLNILIRHFALAVSVSLLLSSCGTSPSLREHQKFDVPAAKLTRVLFFYQDKEMIERTTSAKGSVSMSFSETGYYQFGETLVRRSPAAFQKLGVTVLHSAFIPPGEWKKQAPVILGKLDRASLRGSSMVTVAPVGGGMTASNRSARAYFTFDVRVIDADSAKIAWRGVIDTRTWKGRDFINQHAAGVSFDDSYADEFFDTVANGLRGAGLL